MSPAIGNITFTTSSPQFVVEAELGEGSAALAGGIGGWNDIPRPMRDTAVEWTGHPAYRMSIPIRLDGFAKGKTEDTPHLSVLPQVQQLRAMGRCPSGAARPPVVRIDGAVNGSALDWVIEDLEMGDAIRRQSDGAVIRQDLTVKLVEAKFAAVAAVTAATPGTHKGAPYTAKKGDTLAKLAVKFYKDRHQWRKIGNAQTPKLKDPRRDLAGKRLTIPPK